MRVNWKNCPDRRGVSHVAPHGCNLSSLAGCHVNQLHFRSLSECCRDNAPLLRQASCLYWRAGSLPEHNSRLEACSTDQVKCLSYEPINGTNLSDRDHLSALRRSFSDPSGDFATRTNVDRGLHGLLSSDHPNGSVSSRRDCRSYDRDLKKCRVRFKRGILARKQHAAGKGRAGFYAVAAPNLARNAGRRRNCVVSASMARRVGALM
jgi:hypothetical protein